MSGMVRWVFAGLCVLALIIGIVNSGRSQEQDDDRGEP
jgi:hypothetical protein